MWNENQAKSGLESRDNKHPIISFVWLWHDKSSLPFELFDDHSNCKWGSWISVSQLSLLMYRTDYANWGQFTCDDNITSILCNYYWGKLFWELLSDYCKDHDDVTRVDDSADLFSSNMSLASCVGKIMTRQSGNIFLEKFWICLT